jgi:hypothetical protein
MAVKRDRTITRQKPSRSNSGKTTDYAQDEEGLSVVPARRRRRNHTFLRLLLRLIIVAALIFSGVMIWQNWDLIEPESAIYWINDKLAGGDSGDGFPVEITGSSVLNMSKTNDGLALLTDTSLVVFNSKGGEIFRRQHGFSKPIMRAEGKWILLADTGGNRLKIETRASTPVEMKIDNYLTIATIGRNGNFAVVTDSSKGYTSEVVVYNRKQEPIYHWYDRDLTILDVALSPDGKSMTISGVQAESGAMKCVVKMFDFSKKEPVAQYDSTDLMLFSVRYFPNGTVAAVGDRAVWVLNENGSILQKHSYDDHQLEGFIFSDSSVSVALRDYGGTEGGMIKTINPSGDQAYTMPYEGTFRSLSPYHSGILLLTSEHLYRADAAGIRYTSDAVKDGRMISYFGKDVVVLGLTSLSVCDLPTAKS